jgi:hypothetical protein
LSARAPRASSRSKLSSELGPEAPESPEGDNVGQLDDELIASSPTPLARVTMALQDQASRVLSNWSLRVSTFPALRATPDLNLAQLQDGMPDLLQAILSAVATPDPVLEVDTQSRLATLAAEHGRRLARQAFSIGVMIAELNALRAELWAAILRITADDPVLAATPLVLEERLSGTFGPVMVDAAEAWFEAQRS